MVTAFSGAEELPALDSVEFVIFVDPTTKVSFYSYIVSTLKERTQKIEFEYILKEVTKQVNNISPIPISSAGFSGDQVVVDIRSARLLGKNMVPNPVQHNVPAWSLFAVFFIIISLSGSIIRNGKKEAFSRLLTMPCSYTEYLLSKAVVFLVVTLLQFGLMLLIGIFVLPWFGLESLNLGSSPWLSFFWLCQHL